MHNALQKTHLNEKYNENVLIRTKFMKCFNFDFLEKCWKGLEEFALELVQKKGNENVTLYTAR